MHHPTTSYLRLWLGALLVPAMLTLAPGCSKEDAPEAEEKRCTLDADCEMGSYCGADGVCKSDCDAMNACGGGQSCTARGKCVVTATSCQLPSDCDMPPGGARVCDGETSVVPQSIGRCVAPSEGAMRECRYDDERQPCTAGCNVDTGECNPVAPDPCEGVTCEMPPANSCKDAMTLIEYGDTGSCDEGMCGYNSREVPCPTGCESGACKPGVCEATTCDTIMAPMPSCVSGDPTVAVTYTPLDECMVVDGAPRCFEGVFTDCRFQGASCDAGACVDAIAQSGEVIVTEYMVEPPGEEGAKFAKQWIELYNTTDAAIELRGWTVETATQSHVIAPGMDGMGSLSIPAKTHILLSNGSDPLGDGTAPDYRYSDILLGIEGTLTLKNGADGTVDYLFWKRGSTTQARSRQIEAGSDLTAASNDSPDVWCPNLTDMAGVDGAYGTPGSTNSACADDPCSLFTCGAKPADYCRTGDTAVQYTNDMPGCQVSSFRSPYCDFAPMDMACGVDTPYCLDGACIGVPDNIPTMPGQLIITEVMGDPNGTDTDREWIEVYNTTDAELSLFTLKIEDNELDNKFSSVEILDPTAKVPAKGYAVLATNVDPAVNGGIMGAYELGTGLLKNTPDVDAVTGLSTMTLKIVTADGVVIDEAYYGTPESAEAQQLSLSAYTDAGVTDFTTVNDAATSVCLATIDYAMAVGKGSPGAANEECP